MRVRIITFLCLIALLAISTPIISAQNQYKVHFNNIVCLNPWNTKFVSFGPAYPINVEFMNAAEGKPPTPAPAKWGQYTDYSYVVESIAAEGKTNTKYFNNMSMANFPHNLFAPDQFTGDAVGKANAVSNDRFYMTWRNKPREGFALPIRGGDMDMYRYKFWKPNANDGNPASVVGLDSIIYYLWEADTFSKDNSIGEFSINLKEKKGKGPQLVQVAKGLYEPYPTGDTSQKAYLGSIYVIEYEVK